MSQIDRSEGLVGSTGIKSPVRAATTANITLSGEQTIDSIVCVEDDRVLVKNQTTGSENGIYVVSTGSWSRAADFDGSYDIVQGTLITVANGSANSNLIYQITTVNPITIGTSLLTFAVNDTASVAASGIHGATQKSVIVDADEGVGVDSAASWGLIKWTFTNLWTWIQSHLASPGAIGGTTAAKGTFTSVETSKATVASATTPDIFAAAGNVIDYTGTATCTGFVAATKAGQQRTLICADACLFTAGANLLIEGISSGTTITLAANAIVNVVAITTTQFKMTYSLSGTFTATGTGYTSNPTALFKYKIENGFATLYNDNLTGTSNSTAFTLTGLPVILYPKANCFIDVFLSDNGAISFTRDCLGINTSGGIICYKNGSATGWTASGGKGLSPSIINYGIY